MRGSVVRGTPINVIRDTAGQGIAPGTPRGMEGTQPEQYTSDKRGYQRVAGDGTPYHSAAGNGPEARRVVASGTNLESSDHGNQNDPRVNGQGVVLDGAGEYRRGYAPRSEPTLDSPVPRHAPVFDAGFIGSEDRAHAGERNEQTANPDLLAIGGVMSRGLDSVSHPDEGELELTADDTLKGPEAGSTRDVQGHAQKRITE